MQKLQLKSLEKAFRPSSTKGIVQTSVVYIGVDKIYAFVDGLIGNRISSIGIGLPVLGSFTLRDFLEYITVARGVRFDINTIIGLLVTKFLNQGFSIAGIPGGTTSTPQITTGGGGTTVSPAVVTTGPGMPIG